MERQQNQAFSVGHRKYSGERGVYRPLISGPKVRPLVERPEAVAAMSISPETALGPLPHAARALVLLLRIERRRAGRLAVRADRDRLDAGLGAFQERLAMLLQRFAALVDGDRILEGHV